jgi:developmental checkpoint coupling sporulation initiation to replication initiation
MNSRTFPYLVKSAPHPAEPAIDEQYRIEMMNARRFSDKASLLRPLRDDHLLEVYREAKKMNLSNEFIELLEEAISIRQLEPLKEA